MYSPSLVGVPDFAYSRKVRDGGLGRDLRADSRMGTGAHALSEWAFRQRNSILQVPEWELLWPRTRSVRRARSERA
jgi:hypothetical protein